MKDEWQPIDTASKRGISMLLTGKYANGLPWVLIGHYANGWTCSQDYDVYLEPTHWMPLPSAPEGVSA